MAKMTSVDSLRMAGYGVTHWDKNHAWNELAPSDIPPQVIDAVKAAPLRGLYNVFNQVIFNDQVLRCQTMSLDPASEFVWQLPTTEGAGDFVAIAANTLVLNGPDQGADVAKISLIAPIGPSQLNGEKGTPGSDGSTSVQQDGAAGGPAQPGHPGTAGRTYEYPSVFIFFGTIQVNTPNPNIVAALQIDGPGIDGGHGGDGGRGGRGGNGDMGLAGHQKLTLLGWVCTAGPEHGGTGGQGGSGGEGGAAGEGGNGATVYFVGPAAGAADIQLIEMSIPPGRAGSAGIPGDPGEGGSGGGGGIKPPACPHYASSGPSGAAANPHDLGPGPLPLTAPRDRCSLSFATTPIYSIVDTSK